MNTATYDELLDRASFNVRVMCVEPGAAGQATALTTMTRPTSALLLIGPEGGWADHEWRAAAAAGVRLVTLGHRTLRADAVPIAAISVLQFLWGDL